MTLKTAAWQLLAATCLLEVVEAVKADEPTDDDDDWTYDDQSTWPGECQAGGYQSPIDISMTPFPDPWPTQATASNGGFDILPGLQSAEISKDNHGPENYVYKIKATDGNLGGWYGSEPYFSLGAPFWQITEVRFHYPAEHVQTVDDAKVPYADMEMQLIGQDVYGRQVSCSSGMAGFSFFFNIDDDYSGSQWDWIGQESFTFDPSTFFPKTLALTDTLLGYLGSDTMPDCTLNFCWYMSKTVGSITTSQLDGLKVDGVTSNARDPSANANFLFESVGIMVNNNRVKNDEL